MALKERKVLRRQDDNRDISAKQSLLIDQILIASHKNLNSVRISDLQKVTVLKTIPPLVTRCLDLMILYRKA